MSGACALATLAASAALVGCATAGGAERSAGATVAEAAVSQAPAAPCAAKAPTNLAPERWPAARARLAPRGARAIRLCRYSGLNARPPLGLVSSRLIRSPRVVAQLVDEFDRLPRWPRGPIHCPSDDGSQIVARLAYRASRQVTISVGLEGCSAVTNGSVSRTAAGIGSPRPFGPQLVAWLERLVPVRPVRPRAGSPRALAHGHWSLLARSPLGPRYGAAFVWAGRELLEIGGSGSASGSAAIRDGGAAYAPDTARWRRVASAPAQVAPANGTAVWTGRYVFVFGGPGADTPSAGEGCVAGLYDPSADRWMVSVKAPFGRLEQPTAVWTGHDVILAGLTGGDQPQLMTAAYDPAADTWRPLSLPDSASHRPLAIAMVATNHGVLLWALWQGAPQNSSDSSGGSSGIDVYRLGSAGAWAKATGNWPQHETVGDPVFTGSQILLPPGQIWCGDCPHPAPFDEHGYRVDPRTLRRTPIPHGPLDDLGPQIIWTGAAEVSLNPAGEITGPRENVRPGDIAIWSPVTQRWARGPTAPRQLGDEPAVWSGSRLFVLARSGRLLSYGR